MRSCSLLEGSAEREKEGKIMKKGLCIAVAYIMAAILLSASHVAAIDINKLIGNEYYFTGTGVTYVGGNYAGTAIGEGMLVIGDPSSGVKAVVTALTDYSAWVRYGVFQYYCAFQLGPYTPSIDNLKFTSDTCSAICTGQDNVTEIYNYTGACAATLKFDGQKNVKMKVSFSPQAGVEIVYTTQGTKMGKYPPIP
jgi:hypothetical protein